MRGQLEEGEKLGDYEVISLAGSGGMGHVYKATQVSLGRTVALKVIRDEIANMPEYRERFLREARLAASVDHPHVVTIYDVSSQDDRLFLAMQWIEGADLKEVLAENGRLAPERAVGIATQLAGALDAVHSVSGLIHRDVKPANVLLREVGNEDQAYLTDFGVAKPSEATDQLTQTGWTVGTTGYLSPEQIKGDEPGPRSDLYSLGCLFFEALTGRPPFKADNEMAVRWAHANDPRPSASAALPALGQRYDSFLAIALAVDPEERFASGRAFAEALKAAYGGEPETSVMPTGAPAHAPTAIGPATPLPPSGSTPQPPPPGYPAYGYVTPPPAPSQQSKSGSPLALIILGLVAVAGIAVGALAAAGAFSHSNTTETVTSASKTRPRTSGAPRTATIGSGTKSCGAGVSVGPATTCPFAQNVKQAYEEGGTSGARSVTAYSPATGVTYNMQCTAGPTHTCTGGNKAAVYFGSGESSAPASTSTSSGTPNLRPCDQNISANAATSCPFAENVFRAYWRSYNSNGQESEVVVSAFSSATHQSYSMDCTTEGVTVECSGGNNAFVTFPLHAVEVY